MSSGKLVWSSSGEGAVLRATYAFAVERGLVGALGPQYAPPVFRNLANIVEAISKPSRPQRSAASAAIEGLSTLLRGQDAGPIDGA